MFNVCCLIIKKLYLYSSFILKRKIVMKRTYKNIFFTLLCSFFMFLSCGDKNYPDIPYVNVDRYLYINSMDYIPVGGYKYIDDGYRGLIVYRIMTNEFSVFERCCPHDPEKITAKVFVEESGVICIDTTCGSRFNLVDGGKIEGPSIYPLKMYRHSFDGEVLHIYN